jgi:hypothetical protein
MAALAVQLAKLSQLTSFNLDGNDLGRDGMAIIEPILKRNKRIAALESLIDNAVESFTTHADKDTALAAIQHSLDELHSIANTMERENKLQPTGLYDDYYHLSCRLALTVGDFNTAMASARAMSSLPLATLSPYCNETHPAVFAMVTRQLAQQTEQPLAMATLLEILLQSEIALPINKIERYSLLMRIAGCADPEHKNTAVQAMVRLIEKDRPAVALAPKGAGPLLADQLPALFEHTEKNNFGQIILSVTKQFSGDNDNKPTTFFSVRANRSSLNLLCQPFQDPQKSLGESIITLLEVLNNDLYIKDDPSAKILLPSLANYLELEHNPDQDTAILRDRICSVLTKRPQEKSKPLMR